MKSVFTKAIAAVASATMALCAFSSNCLAASNFQTAPVTLSIGKICISTSELAQNDYKVTIPVRAFGATQGVISFDSAYIAFGDIDSQNGSLDIGNVSAQNGELSISNSDISSKKYTIKTSYLNDFACIGVGGYCGENQPGETETLFEMTFTLPKTASLGDVYNIVWYDALNARLSPAVSSVAGDYDINYSNGLVYIGSLDVTNTSNYENMYLADDTSALTSAVSLELNSGTAMHKSFDISSMISFGVDGCGSLDINHAQEGNTCVSPFDLYWGTYQNLTAANDFSGSCTFDPTCFDKLCDQIGTALNITLNPCADFMFFSNVLFDDDLKPLGLGDFNFKIAQRGDANLDHSIDAKDAAAIASYSAIMASGATTKLSENDNALAMLAADVDGDSEIGAKDSALIANYSAQSSIYGGDTIAAYCTIWKNLLD